MEEKNAFMLEDDKEQFIAERKRIKSTFELFDRDNKGVCNKDDIGTMMRYLGAFPTEEELIHDILPKLCEEEDSKQVKYTRFEPFMVKVIVERNYEPDSEDTLMQAFKVLDPTNKEYIEEPVMVSSFTSQMSY